VDLRVRARDRPRPPPRAQLLGLGPSSKDALYASPNRATRDERDAGRHLVLLHVARELLERLLPERPPALEERRRFVEWPRFEMTAMVPAFAPPAHEARMLENAQVLAHGGERHLERLRELRDRRFAA